ncbi:MAG: hypothetical protein FWD58_06190 [Firmicutes bacterium]|nr:hypothetical protein [Bacillota bacterium]
MQLLATRQIEEREIILENGKDYTDEDCTKHCIYNGEDVGKFMLHIKLDTLAELVRKKFGEDAKWSWVGYEDLDMKTTRANVQTVMSVRYPGS